MRCMVKPYGVRCVNTEQMQKTFPAKIAGGWELKSYALMYNAFEEVLLIDADNMVVRNPEYLFETVQYKKTGAILWPDQEEHTLARTNPIWNLCEVRYRHEPAVESGQLMADKRRCWHAMTLALFLNENSDLYYQHIYGDKDTFHMAWRRLNQEYAQPSRSYDWLEHTMCQHDFDMNRVFQHRCKDKWRLHPRNERVPGFLHEDLCFRFLDELEENWDLCAFPVSRWNSKEKEMGAQVAASRLLEKRYWYERGDGHSRVLSFSRDGTVGEGSGHQERYWNLRVTHQGTFLDISNVSGVTCIFRPNGDGRWQGERLWDKEPIHLEALAPGDPRNQLLASPEKSVSRF
jgi:hypothetical protein